MKSSNSHESRFLILETSGRVGQVALAEGLHLRGVRRLDEARRHARDLAPAVRDLLAELGWTSRDVQSVIVSRGPGSYTGLRVGIMSAKTFAFATGCALLAVDTFAAITLQAPAEADRLDVLADAQQKRIYVQRFVRSGETAEWQPESALRIENLEEWLLHREADVWVTGPGLATYELLAHEGKRVVKAEDWHPRPESLVQIGLGRYLAGARDDVWSVEPLYLRPSSAEEKWRARSGP
jgi:tRNA threonylcarbamoyladenosine biosynthesis protein TsaB